MNDRDSDSAITVSGTGEFQRKELHVIATVEMRAEVIVGVGFAAAKGDAPPEGAAELEALLAGRDVHEALRLLASDRDLTGKPESFGREVLIEAFHRAVEACLDQQ